MPGMEHNKDMTREGYDKVAAQYARQYLSELDYKPLDRQLLERLAAMTSGKGRVCDLGCGPGHVARYLREQGADAFGIDLSPGMVEQARQAHPGIDFRQGDMRALDLPDNSLAGIAAFYSLLHIPRSEVTEVLRELLRVLKPGGVLLAAFHIGDETLHREELLGESVSLDFAFFTPGEMARYMGDAGFSVDETIEREPYPDVEYPSRRAYIFASKPL